MSDKPSILDELAAQKQQANQQEYEVVITETLKKSVFMRADSKDDAEQQVYDQWNNSEHILGAEEFAGVEVKAYKSERIAETAAKTNTPEI